MASDKLIERELLGRIKEATGYPGIKPIDSGLSGRILVDHVIGILESAIEDNGGYAGSPKIIREGYDALKELYPLHFRKAAEKQYCG